MLELDYMMHLFLIPKIQILKSTKIMYFIMEQ